MPLSPKDHIEIQTDSHSDLSSSPTLTLPTTGWRNARTSATSHRRSPPCESIADLGLHAKGRKGTESVSPFWCNELLRFYTNEINT